MWKRLDYITTTTFARVQTDVLQTHSHTQTAATHTAPPCNCLLQGQSFYKKGPRSGFSLVRPPSPLAVSTLGSLFPPKYILLLDSTSRLAPLVREEEKWSEWLMWTHLHITGTQRWKSLNMFDLVRWDFSCHLNKKNGASFLPLYRWKTVNWCYKYCVCIQSLILFLFATELQSCSKTIKNTSLSHTAVQADMSLHFHDNLVY